VIEERALQSKSNRPLPRSGSQTDLVEQMPGKTTTCAPTPKYGIETIRLSVFAPPGSFPDRQSSLTLNNPASKPSVANHQVAIPREFIGQTFQHMAAQHMVKSRTAACSDKNSVDIELLGRMGDSFGGVV
jgi:hypothetical protein